MKKQRNSYFLSDYHAMQCLWVQQAGQPLATRLLWALQLGVLGLRLMLPGCTEPRPIHCDLDVRQPEMTACQCDLPSRVLRQQVDRRHGRSAAWVTVLHAARSQCLCDSMCHWQCARLGGAAAFELAVTRSCRRAGSRDNASDSDRQAGGVLFHCVMVRPAAGRTITHLPPG